MALDVSKPGDDIFNTPPKLSPFGKIVIAVLAAAVAVLVVMLIVHAVGQNKQAALAQPVDLAISRALDVGDRYITALNVPSDDANQYSALKDKIANEKNIDNKVTLANQALAVVLKYANGNQSATDEINGSLNRIQVAYSAYKKGS